MINEKVIVETLANNTKSIAGLQSVLAGFSELLASGLPNLSPEQQATLRKGATDMLALARLQQSAGEKLLSELRASQN